MDGSTLKTKKMGDFNHHIKHIISRKSFDVEIGNAIEYFINTLDSLNIQYIVMGSTGIQTYLEYFHRLPNDLDILLQEDDILKIVKICDSDANLTFEYNEVASKVVYKNKFYLHLVPNKMNIIDKIENVIFTKINVYHLDRTIYRNINLINFSKSIAVRVPILEYMFCLNMLVRLDTNNFSDNISILEKYNLNDTYIKEFTVRVPEMNEVLKNRVEELRNKLSIIRKDLLDKLPCITS
ncbi:MAG TPA: hypothetical protein VJY62_09845 [Bacteroidia bacterium]|nr:hypothetical protein [Bacteroidia bacterium]